MIPRLDSLEPLERAYRDYLSALRGAGFEGDIHPDYATRLVTATDNSVYQILPQAVTYPRHAKDVSTLMSLASKPEFAEITFAARGGGTGTNGQSLSDGVIVDVSRHMNAIVEVNPDERWVRVQPGVVLDQLNAHLEQYGLFFAPNLSPSSRATLGGMISTDACGKGSRIYGRTSEHVLSLGVVFQDGTPWTSEPMGQQRLMELRDRSDIVGRIHREVDDVVTGNRELIASQFPKLRRFMTGYNLAMVYDRDRARFDLNPLLSGSEGTLVFVVEARLRLTPIPAARELVVLKYGSFEDALGSAELVVRSNPGAIETIDETVLGLAREDIIWRDVAEALAPADGEPPAAAINLVEYEGADATAVRAQVDALIAEVSRHRGAPDHPFGWVVARTPAERSALWTLRKKGVGLLGNAPGPRKPIAFVEDTVVPPAHLRAYIREFRALLDDAGVRYGMFGHIDVGCLHVRPALDLTNPDDELLLRSISDRVVEIVARYGGVIWGEHGKGMRSEYNPVFFGEALYAQLCRIKAAFDPSGRLNPGKLAVPTGSNGSLASVDGPKRGHLDRRIPAETRGHFRAAMECNGNGACFSVDPTQVMCPSARATQDRIHSPKGRAGVMRDWLRQLAEAGSDPVAGLRSRPGPFARAMAYPARLARALRRRLGQYDYSNEVHAAMDGCLACKACATQCPIRVDVPRFRSEFLALYHDRYPRPLRDHLIGQLESTVSWMSRAPRLSNTLTQSWVGRASLRLAGLVDTPRLSVPSARSQLASRGVAITRPAELESLTPTARAQMVAVLPDAFTMFYEAPVLLALIDLIALLGFKPVLLPYLPSGKGLHVRGFLTRFQRIAERNVERLALLARWGIPVVGIDPAVVLVYRDEVPHAVGTSSPPAPVLLLQEWLADQHDRLSANVLEAEAGESGPYKLLIHCTEQTAVPSSASLWRGAFAAAGLTLTTPRVGCCGMCGAYGHERHHRDHSRDIFEASWAPLIPEAAEDRQRLLSTGHSCRSQVKRFAAHLPLHPVQALLAELRPKGMVE